MEDWALFFKLDWCCINTQFPFREAQKMAYPRDYLELKQDGDILVQATG